MPERTSSALNLAQAARRIRELLKAGARVAFTTHAREEMRKDKVTIFEVYEALRSCHVVRPAEMDLKHGTWKYTTEGRSEARVIGVVVVIEEEPDGLTVVTVWEVKGRWH